MTTDDDAVWCDGLTRDFGSIRALDHVDLTVARGTVFGFLGPNGAGKTTAIRLLLGLIAPTAGRVRVLGCELPAGGSEVRRRTGTVLENHGLYEGLTVRASLEFAAGAFGLARAQARQRVEEVVDGLGLGHRLDERPRQLSRGMRQRLAVARALVGRPELLVLDEPTNGLDAAAAAGLRREVVDLATGGTTVFLTTHLLAEAERVCDLVAVVKQGRVIATGTPTELRRGESVRRVRVEGRGVPDAAARMLAAGSWTSSGPDGAVVTVDGLDGVSAVVSSLVRAGAALHRVEPEGQTLEAAFLSLISDEPPDGDAAPPVKPEQTVAPRRQPVGAAGDDGGWTAPRPGAAVTPDGHRGAR